MLASSPLKVTNITIEIESRFIRTLIVPSRFTGKPIEVLLQLHYEPDLCLIELLDCQISANEDASVIIRGIFKLLSGRLEGAVERYFPLDPAEKMKSLIANLPNSGQIKFHFDDLRFLELQFLKGQLKVEMEYSMCIAMA